MATEEENQEMLMSEAVNIDLALGGKYLGSTDVRSSLEHVTIAQVLGVRCMQ